MRARFQHLRGAFRALPLLGALLALLAVVALASRSGRSDGTTSPPTVPLFVFDLVFTIMAIVIVATLVVGVIVTPRLRSPRPERRRQWVRNVILVSLAISLLAVSFSQIRFHKSKYQPPPAPEPAFTRERSPKPQTTATKSVRFRWEIAAVTGVLACGAVVVWYLLRRRRPEEHGLEVEETLPAELSELFDDTLGDLERERDPRRAVIAAYARAEAILGRHGLPRRASEAPFEYLARVLKGLRVSAQAIVGLTELFERAKFSAHEVDHAMKAEAIAAVAAVRDDLRTEASV